MERSETERQRQRQRQSREKGSLAPEKEGAENDRQPQVPIGGFLLTCAPRCLVSTPSHLTFPFVSPPPNPPIPGFSRHPTANYVTPLASRRNVSVFRAVPVPPAESSLPEKHYVTT